MIFSSVVPALQTVVWVIINRICCPFNQCWEINIFQRLDVGFKCVNIFLPFAPVAYFSWRAFFRFSFANIRTTEWSDHNRPETFIERSRSQLHIICVLLLDKFALGIFLNRLRSKLVVGEQLSFLPGQDSWVQTLRDASISFDKTVPIYNWMWLM